MWPTEKTHNDSGEDGPIIYSPIPLHLPLPKIHTVSYSQDPQCISYIYIFMMRNMIRYLHAYLHLNLERLSRNYFFLEIHLRFFSLQSFVHRSVSTNNVKILLTFLIACQSFGLYRFVITSVFATAEYFPFFAIMFALMRIRTEHSCAKIFLKTCY